MSAGVGSPFWRDDKGRVALPGAEVLSQWAGRCRKIFPEGREGSGGHSDGLAGVGSPYWRTDRGQEAIPEVWEGWEAHSEGGRLFQRACRGRKTFVEGRESSGGRPCGTAG